MNIIKKITASLTALVMAASVFSSIICCADCYEKTKIMDFQVINNEKSNSIKIDELTETPLYLQDNWHLGTESDNNIDRGAYPPIIPYNISNGPIIVDGYSPQDPLYSQYLYTGSSTMGIGIKNKSYSVTVTVGLYGVGSSSPITSFDLSPGETKHKAVYGLSSIGLYYIKYTGDIPNYFEVNGYVAEVVQNNWNFT